MDVLVIKEAEQIHDPMTDSISPAPLPFQLRRITSGISEEYQRLEAENVAAGGEEGAIIWTQVDNNVYELLCVLREIFKTGLKERSAGLFGTSTAKTTLLSLLSEITLRHDMIELSNLPAEVDPIFSEEQKHLELAWFIMALNDLALPQYMEIIRQNTALAKQYYDEPSLILDEENCIMILDTMHELEKVYFQLEFRSYAEFCKKQQSPIMKSSSFASLNSSLSKLSVNGQTDTSAGVPSDGSTMPLMETNSKETSIYTPSSGESESIRHCMVRSSSIPARGSPLKMAINSDEALNDYGSGEDESVQQPMTSATSDSEAAMADGFSSETTLTTIEGEDKIPSESSKTSDLGFFGFQIPPITSILQRHSILATAANMIGMHPPISMQPKSIGAVPGDFEAIDRIDEKERARLLCLGTSIELKICPTKGLDFQHFKCYDCQTIIGIADYPPAKLCEVSGMYYCPDCHQDAETLSPALIVRNWDFRRVKVSRKTYQLLAGQCTSDLIDIEELNPDLFLYISQLQTAQKLRTEMCRYMKVAKTCEHSHKEALMRRIWPREHLIETVGLYSIDDLVQLNNGTLLPHLQILARSLRNHVTDVCQSCKQRLMND